MQQASNILQIDNLSKYFGGLAAVSNCSLKIKEGSITGIIGPNGSGKTTLFNLIAGNLKSSDGKVLYKKDRKQLLEKGEQTAKEYLISMVLFIYYQAVKAFLSLMMYLWMK